MKEGNGHEENTGQFIFTQDGSVRRTMHRFRVEERGRNTLRLSVFPIRNIAVNQTRTRKLMIGHIYIFTEVASEHSQNATTQIPINLL